MPKKTMILAGASLANLSRTPKPVEGSKLVVPKAKKGLRLVNSVIFS